MKNQKHQDSFDVIIFMYVQELERQQRERNCSYLAKILNSMKNITYRTTWSEVTNLTNIM